jgi:hypothetical protein
MSSRKQAFLKTVEELQEEFLVHFPNGPTASTQSIIDRVRRSLSWLHRAASQSDEDRPPRFVDLWIALNALYSQPRYAKEPREKEDFSEFIQRLAGLPSGGKQLTQLIGKKHIQVRAQELIQNKYLWNEWWSKELDRYREKSGERSVRLEKAMRNDDAPIFLYCLFERLQVLRNQIVHGSSSASTRKSRDALYPAILLLEEILPEFIRLMIHAGHETSWPPIPYPGKGTPQHSEQQ